MSRCRVTLIGLVVVILVSAASSVIQADWPQWRGPSRDGKSPETGLLKSWPEGGPTRVWLYEACGLGYGGPAIVGNRLFITGTRDDKEVLLALDATTGDEQWMTPIGEIYEENHGDGPRSTPAVDDGLVFVLGGTGTLLCADARTGEALWTKAMQDLGGEQPHWGYCESPYVYKDTVLCSPGGDQGAIVALDKRTGEVVWQSSEIKSNAHYSSIAPMNHDGDDEAVQLFPDQLVGFNLADGKLLWSAPWRNPIAAISTPLVHDQYVYATSGYGKGCMLVEITPDHEARQVYDEDVMKVMKNKQGGVVLVGDHLYGHSEGVGWVCQEFLTGNQEWRDRGVMAMGSILYADGMLYCLDEETGEVALVEPSPEKWEERSRFKLSPQSDQRVDQGRVWTHPVICDGKLLLRDQNLVYCFDIRDAKLARAGE